MTKVIKILLTLLITAFLGQSLTSCKVIGRVFFRKDPFEKVEDKQKSRDKEIMKSYNKGVEQYKKEVAGSEKEKGKQYKVYKRMKKNEKVAKRINNNKPRENWFIRTFKKNRVKDPFYRIWTRRIERFWKEKVKKDK